MEKGYGRIDVRICRVIAGPETLAWLDPQGARPGLRSIATVTGKRRVDGAAPSQTRYHISSLPGDVETVADAVRSRWGIGNRLHWVLDVPFNEDTNRSRLDHCTEILAVIRKMAPNILSQEPSRSIGVKGGRLKAGWDDGHLLRVLGFTKMREPCGRDDWLDRRTRRL